MARLIVILLLLASCTHDKVVNHNQTDTIKYEEIYCPNCDGIGQVKMSSGDSKIRHFDNSTCDVVFVVVITGDMYEIPSSEINVKGALTLTSDWDKYKVSL